MSDEAAPNDAQQINDNLPATVLDLDTLEREGGSKPPFVFQHNGKRYLLSDPQDVDWQKLIDAMASPFAFFRNVLPADDQREFFASPMASWKMNALMEAYMKHYGLNLGEAGASPV